MLERFTFGISVEIGEPFPIVATDQAAGWGSASHPFMCPLSTNRIMITYWVCGDGTRSGDSKVDWPMYSDDNGKTWVSGDPMTWVSSNPTKTITTSFKKGERFSYNLGYCFGYCVQSNGLRIGQGWAVHAVAGPSSKCYSVDAVFSRDGTLWEGPVAVSYKVPSNLTTDIYLSQKAVQLVDGSILVVGYTRLGGGSKYSCLMFRSTDGGFGYEYWSTPGAPSDAPWGAIGAGEPGIELLTSGDIVCVMRTGTSSAYSEKGVITKMLQSTSGDGGRTWKKKLLNRPGVMPKLLQMSNGLLVCAFGRPGNNLMFSLDNGKSWGAEVEITPADLRSTGYMDIAEVEPGRLLVIYDAYNTTLSKFWLWDPPDEFNGIFGVFVDVKRRK